MLNAGFYDMKDYLDGGWVTGLKYESEVIEDLKERTQSKDKPLKKVGAHIRVVCEASFTVHMIINAPAEVWEAYH